MLPEQVQQRLDMASFRTRRATFDMLFECHIFDNEWDDFVATWATKAYGFIRNTLGPFQKEPQPIILAVDDGHHSAGANASFQPDNGQVRLCPDYVVGRAGTTLEKITHELTHANLNDFPEGDPFYEEGVTDYCVWCMAHAPVWGPYRQEMIDAAAHNIAARRDRAMKTQTDYDRKRWAGGLYTSVAHGPWILSRLMQKKIEGDLTW